MEKDNATTSDAMSQDSKDLGLAKEVNMADDLTETEKQTANTATADIPVPPETIAEETKPASQPVEYIEGSNRNISGFGNLDLNFSK